MNLFSFNLKVLIFILILNLNAFSEKVDDIEIKGNQRISIETIKLFANVKIGDDIKDDDINRILKDLYETNFFNDVKIKFKDKILFIEIIEEPIIQNLSYDGVKSKSILDKITKDKIIREKSSYNEFRLSSEKNRISALLKDLGYYNSSINTSVKTLNNNQLFLFFRV